MPNPTNSSDSLPVSTQLNANDQFLLHGPCVSYSARGIKHRIFQDSINALTSQVAIILNTIDKDKHAPSVVIGALPFERTSPCWLYQPNAISNTLNETLTFQSQRCEKNVPDLGASYLRMEPQRAFFEEMVRLAITKLHQNQTSLNALRKVVLARSLIVDRNTPFEKNKLLQRMLEDTSVTTYCVPLPAQTTNHAPRHLVGATPERLISRKSTWIESHPLAGSARRNSEPNLDREAGNRLLVSAKDQGEHRIVVEFIADLLAPLCSQLLIPKNPSLNATRSMWHLGTRITGTLKYPDDMNTSSSLAIAARLQPTPALCGDPRDSALKLIHLLEPFQRDYYGGAVGWSNTAGDGDWYVSIRCAEIQANHARLFAGAGIMHDSNPQAEADETVVKFSAMIHALELEELLETSDRDFL